jgi:serine protease Do
MRVSEEGGPGSSGDGGAADVRAFLESLSGPSRGEIIWLADAGLAASVGRDRSFRVAPSDAKAAQGEDVATLKWSPDGHTVTALPGRTIWVNGQKTASAVLRHGDTVEFGETGPITRYRLCDHAFPAHRTAEDILSDAYAYARTSRRPLASKVSGAVRDSGRRLAVQTTVFFRISVGIALLLVAALGYLLYQNDRMLAENLENEARKIEAVAVMLAQTREDALTPDDLAALKDAFENQLISTEKRLGTLEMRAGASTRIITASIRSVAFIQGAYGLRQAASGKLLRHMVGPDEKMKTPFGQPWITPEGTGEPAEFQFTGTGFLLRDGHFLVTNRHIALPWTGGGRIKAFETAGLKPEMLKLLVFLPGQTLPIEATLHRVSDTADVALLSVDPERVKGLGLALSDEPPRPGEEIFLLGYPTGLKALLAQAGPDFLTVLEQDGSIDFWKIAMLLSERDIIRPLASRGIVAQTSAGAVAYDAETTTGGSGGPALNRNGEVIAVNAAILPEFGGSNIGVPVPHLKSLLAEAGDE